MKIPYDPFNDIQESYSVALYDMDIEDVEERKNKRLIFTPAVKAANFLGITPQKLYNALKPNNYLRHRESNKKYAARRIKNI